MVTEERAESFTVDNSDGFLGEVHIDDIPFVAQLVGHRLACIEADERRCVIGDSFARFSLVLAQCLETQCFCYRKADGHCLSCDLFGV